LNAQRFPDRERSDMRKGMVDVATPDGVADSYLVVPDGGGPGVLLFMDAFGLRPRIEEMAEAIAARGYSVLAPNLLYRGGRAPLFDLADLADPDKRGALFGQLMPLIGALTPAAITSDAGAYLDFLAAQDGVEAGPAVITGYCMGGTNALRVIEALPDRVKAIASFHGGRLATDQPDSPHLLVGNITGEVYFGHADHDHSMNADQIKLLEAALDEAGVTYTSEVYEGADHGFTMTDTAAYHESGEKRHWENLFALLERTR
jgi:carboxymethylenebutenolidase